ncbi:MAG TPA: PfkB family carbohydrate kinase, partial [Wenzhouxiangella sp.]|nr:PfkB family carbohydrate kinase [Wenzhouxiangella sp.]
LIRMAESADWLTVNSYEWEMLRKKTDLDVETIVDKLSGGLIVTHGGQGSQLVTRDRRETIPAVSPEAVRDPTGCGDAYRAGLLFGLERDWDPVDACRLGSILGAIKIAHAGPQQHDFTPTSVARRFQSEFGKPMPA